MLTTTAVRRPSGVTFEPGAILPTFHAAATAADLRAYPVTRRVCSRLNRPVRRWGRRQFALFGLILRAYQFPENAALVDTYVMDEGSVREKLDEASDHYASERARMEREVDVARQVADADAVEATPAWRWKVHEMLDAYQFMREDRLQTTRGRALLHIRDRAFFDTRVGISNACVQVVFPLIVSEARLAMARLRPGTWVARREAWLHPASFQV